MITWPPLNFDSKPTATYSLFIDDERYPPIDDRCWVIVRSALDAIECIGFFGFPTFISFDHDLGEVDGEVALNGYDVVKMIVERVLDGVFVIPPNFTFYVHSQNPVGKRNIESLLNNFLHSQVTFCPTFPLRSSSPVSKLTSS